MPRSQEDLEAYLTRLERRFERLDDGTYLVALAPGQPPVALHLSPPVLVMQVHIGDVPTDDPAAAVPLLRRLLEYNAGDLLHASYGLNGSRIVLSAALEMDNLDFNELEAALADVGMALVEHIPLLRSMVKQQA